VLNFNRPLLEEHFQLDDSLLKSLLQFR
jgi:hypothetical protein